LALILLYWEYQTNYSIPAMQDEVIIMQSTISTWATALALVVSATSAAAARAPDADCAVLLPSAINAGQPYTVKVVRVPSYPGGWVSPTITVDVIYPTTPGNVIGDTREQTIQRFNVTYALANFTVPEAFDPVSNEAVIASGGSAVVSATVMEPINKKKFRETTCSASVTVY
jgi:hypothetical protein